MNASVSRCSARSVSSIHLSGRKSMSEFVNVAVSPIVNRILD